jgi:hypothetical protein
VPAPLSYFKINFRKYFEFFSSLDSPDFILHIYINYVRRHDSVLEWT